MHRQATQKLSLTAMFLSMGFVLPFLTGQIPQIGSMLLPMHIPVFLCALICGWRWSVPMSALLPLLRSLIFSKPNLYPEALAIAFELATYAFVVGILFERAKQKSLWVLYVSMLAAMTMGRAVRGVVQLILLRAVGMAFPFETFLTSVVVVAIPGIVLQLVLIPAVMLALRRVSPPVFVPHKKHGEK